jgi:hypothetical protein
MTIRTDAAALSALADLASAALEEQILQQIELDVIANGTARPEAPRVLINKVAWKPCPCGNTIDLDDELVCEECRASIGA